MYRFTIREGRVFCVQSKKKKGMKSTEKMLESARRLGLPRTKIVKIFGVKALKETTRGAGRQRRSAGARPVGRPRALSKKHAGQLHAIVRRLQETRGQTAEITSDAIFRKWKSKACSLKTVQRWLSSNYRWRPPSSRVQLTARDVEERGRFKAARQHRQTAFWKKVCFVDGHTVPKVSSLRAARHVAKSKCRGQYRRLEGGRVARVADLPPCHARVSRKLRFNTGGSFKFVIACNYDRGVFFMYPLKKLAGWNAREAGNMYAALRRAIGHKRPVYLLEDNDPVWKEPSSGARREAEGLLTLPGGFPHRSPDLNPLDFGVNSELDKRILRACRRRPRARMSSVEYSRRVIKIAKSKPMAVFTRKCILGMSRRVAALDPAVVT